MANRKLHKSKHNPSLIALAVAACFAGHAGANPTAPRVISGVATFQQSGNTLNITNTPNAIINWGSFSIGTNEVTRFIQQSQASAVLNRVVGQDPSSILGSLQSNGRVFLINPNGILFGAGSQINVSSLVASTLPLSNEDFLAGRMRFGAAFNPGEALNNAKVLNEGSITTSPGGNVYLIGSAVANNGIITSPRGDVLLAAGNSVELVEPGTPNQTVKITAPDNEARNLGQIVAESGKVGIFAGVINQAGTISADSAVTEGGRILLKATKNTTLEGNSVTTASGFTGGRIEIQSGDTTLVSGAVEAKGLNIPPSQGVGGGAGGTVHVLGNLVGLTGTAQIDASGDTGGGNVLVGGDFQGNNPDIQNAFRTYVGPDARIHADAVTGGNGGKVIVWSDDATRAYGTISARGGAQSGDGGLVETSGLNNLQVTRVPDVSAPKGRNGTWLIDPNDISIVAGGGNTNINATSPFLSTDDGAQLGVDLINAALNAGTDVVITTGTAGSSVQAGDINVNAAVSKTLGGNATLTLNAHNDINLNASITSSAGQLNMVLNPDQDGIGGGVVNLSTTVLDANGGTISAAGKTVNLASGSATASIGSEFSIGNLNFSGGVITGPGNVTVNGTLNWTGGHFDGTGQLTIPSGAVMNINGAADVSIASRTINNSGTINWLGAGDIVGGLGATINNQSGGLFTVQNDRQMYVNSGVGDAFFNNNSGAVFRKTGGTGTTTIGIAQGWTFANNAGATVEVQSGTLRFGSSLTPHTSAGAFDIASGAAVQIANTFAMDTGTTFTGAGVLELAHSNASVAGTVSAQDVNVTGGFTGAGNLTVNGTLNWTGGQIVGSGQLTIPSGAVMNINSAADVSIASRTINNSGTINWLGAGNIAGGFGATINNQSGGLFTVQNDRQMYVNSGDGQAFFNNNSSAVFRKTTGTGTTTIGGAQGWTFANNAGATVEVQSGTLSFAGTLGTHTYDGTISIASGATFQKTGGFTNGGTLTGSGTVDVGVGNTLINDGTIQAGAPGIAGTLSITGNLTQGATGVIDIDMAGAVPASDVLAVSGSATLGGTLNINYLDTPAFGGQVTNRNVMTFASQSGAFAATTKSGPGAASWNFSHVVNPTSVTWTNTDASGGGTVSWDGGAGDFLWTSPLNWSGDALPISTQDVTIGALGTPVTLSSGSYSINSLISNTNLIFSGGSLAITNPSTVNATVTVSGGTLTANGGLTTNGLNVSSGTLNGLGSLVVNNSFAHSGGTISGFNLLDITQSSGNLNFSTPLSVQALTATASAGNINVISDITATGNLTLAAQGGDLNITGASVSGQAITLGGNNIKIGSAGATTASSVTGSGLMTVNATGTLTLTGANAGSNISAELISSGGQNITASGISLTGGGGSFNSVTISQSGAGLTQDIAITGGGTLSLTGGAGANGNPATIASFGAQTITFPASGNLTIGGGSVGSFNNASIEAINANQTVNGNPNIMLTGGASGGVAGSPEFGNYAIIQILGVGASNQTQTISANNLTLQGGSGGEWNTAEIWANTQSPIQIVNAIGNVAIMGGSGNNALAGINAVFPGASSAATVNVGGSLTLSGGTGGGAAALISSERTSTITVNGQADVTLSKGSGINADAAIGAVNGGSVTLKAGLGGAGNIDTNDGLVGHPGATVMQHSGGIFAPGNVAMQANAAGGQITQGTGGVIRANTLTTSSNAGATLSGTNQVSIFNATNTVSGVVVLNNASSLLTIGNVTTNNQPVTITNTGDINFAGTLNAGSGSVTLTSTGGSILDGHAGLDIVGGVATLTAGGSVGMAADPLETSVGTFGALGNELSFANSGDLVLTSIPAGATNVTVGADGNLSLGSPLAVSSNLTFNAGSGINLNQSLSTSGNLNLNAGGSDIHISGTTVSAANLSLTGNNISVGSASATSPTLVTGTSSTTVQAAGALTLQGGSGTGASAELRGGPGTLTIAAAGNVMVSGGSGAGAFGRLLGDPDVNMTVGGTVQIQAGTGSGAFAAIESVSPNSIYLTFLNLSSGGYFVNGVEGMIFSGGSGFLAGGLPAVLGQNLNVSYMLSSLVSAPDLTAQLAATILASDNLDPDPSDLASTDVIAAEDPLAAEDTPTTPLICF